MKFLILVGLVSFQASAAVRSYECVNSHAKTFTFTVGDTEGVPVDRWEADGDDGFYPFNCDIYDVTAGGKVVFNCQTYQGVRYGFLTIPKSLPPKLKVNFMFLDPRDERPTGRYDGDCNLVVQ